MALICSQVQHEYPSPRAPNAMPQIPELICRAILAAENSRSAVLPRWNIEPGGATVDPGNQKEES